MDREPSQADTTSRLPLESVASPIELPIAPGEPIRWYRPGWRDTAQAMGWRWIYFLPALLLLIPVAIFPFHMAFANLIVPWLKVLFILIAIPVGIALKGGKDLIRKRQEPFCIHCGYVLTGLPDKHNCPECGRGYTFSLIEEYRRDPAWFIERYRRQHLLPPREAPFAAGEIRRRKSRDGT